MEQLQAFDGGTCGTSDLTDVLDGGCHEHVNWDGDCCCNCRWHIEDWFGVLPEPTFERKRE